MTWRRAEDQVVMVEGSVVVSVVSAGLGGCGCGCGCGLGVEDTGAGMSGGSYASSSTFWIWGREP